MVLQIGSLSVGGHTSPQDVHIFVQDIAPTVAESVAVGDIWSDTTGNLIKRCTGVSPVTFTSIEGGGSGSMTTVKEDNVQVGGADIVTLDFGTGFDVAESPDTEVQISLDLSEIASGGELGGNMDAPTVDATHSGSAHHAESHDYDTHIGGVPFAEVEYDDATSDPLPADETVAADGVEVSAARKDHRHLGHAASHTLASHSVRAHADLSDAPATAHQALVTLLGTPDYITLSGQAITRGLIVLTTDVSGVLPIANGGVSLSALPDVEAWISAAAMKGLATAGAGDADKLPESRELATNDINIDFMAFDPSTEEHAYFNYSLPKGWDEGTITFTPYWTAASGSGGVTFGLAGLAVSNDGALDVVVGTEINVDDTLLAADDVHIGPESAAVTLGGTPAESDWCYFVIARKVADANDTLAVDAQLLGIKLTFTRASYTD